MDAPPEDGDHPLEDGERIHPEEDGERIHPEGLDHPPEDGERIIPVCRRPCGRGFRVHECPMLSVGGPTSSRRPQLTHTSRVVVLAEWEWAGAATLRSPP